MFLLPLQHAYVIFLPILLLSNRLVDAQECSATVAELTAGTLNRVTVPCVAKELVLTDSQRNGTHLNMADCALNSTMELGLNRTNNAGNLKITFLCDELQENKCYTFTVASAALNASEWRDSVRCGSSIAPSSNQAALRSSRAAGAGLSSINGSPTAQYDSGVGASQKLGGNYPSSTTMANSGSTLSTAAVNPTTTAGNPATAAGNPTTTPSLIASATAPGGIPMTTPMPSTLSAASGGTSSSPPAMEATNNTQSADSCSQSLQQCLAREARGTHQLVNDSETALYLITFVHLPSCL